MSRANAITSNAIAMCIANTGLALRDIVALMDGSGSTLRSEVA